MTLAQRVCSAAFAAIAATVLAAAALVSWATAHGASDAWRLPFRLICHGIESRAFVVLGSPMPICARCTGFYVGMIVGIAVAVTLGRRRASPLPAIVALASFAPLAIDGLGQFAGLWATGNWPRAATGVVAGGGFLLWAVLELRGRPVGEATAPSVDGGKELRARAADTR